MDYEAFMQLPEEDRQQAYISLEDYNTAIAERDSFRKENESLRQQAQELRESEKKTKELNFTLARKLNTEKPPEDPLELLHKMMTER